MTDAFRSALHQVVRALSQGSSIQWALTGSTSMFLQGMALVVHDIDVQTTAEGAYEVERRLQQIGKSVTRVYYRQSAVIRSHYGKLLVREEIVEIMGAIEHLGPSNEWEPPVELSSIVQWINWESEKLPVLSLEHELRAYKQMGRWEKAKKIEAFLRRAK